MDCMTSTIEFANLPLLRGISQDDLNWLLTHSELKSLKKNQVLLSPEQDNHTVYILLTGCLIVQFDQSKGGMKAYLDSGNWVGEMSVIDNTRPSATVITDTEVQLLAIPANVLWGLIERSHVAARNLLHALSSRIRHDNELIAEGMQQQRIFSEKAQTDFLTGLRNRHWLDERLPEILLHQNAGNFPCSVMMMDIDNFKAFNDRYGHLAGDRVLQAVATVVRENLRERDVAIRYGGEELMIVLPDTGGRNAEQIAQRLCARVREQDVEFYDGDFLPAVTVSIGVYTITKGDSPEQVLNKVDTALYLAKHKGRDQVVVWTEKELVNPQ